MKEQGLSEPECPRPILGTCEFCPIYRHNLAKCWVIYREVDSLERPECFATEQAKRCVNVNCFWFQECTITLADKLYGVDGFE